MKLIYQTYCPDSSHVSAFFFFHFLGQFQAVVQLQFLKKRPTLMTSSEYERHSYQNRNSADTESSFTFCFT